ncbi:hypothetical protein Dsin_002261 [Dipteronia sinensis]|uniref:RNase H type-1 domain-containing protein n=1 Tax=Dipteronia sinensis TaxID=43782 RepID=A0AAE0EL30_9ROSI|nr:hypothetical protein Dsin_002261 [Dipteronia sinensis]
MESDSLTAVQLLAKDTNPNHPMFGLIQSCKRIVAADWNCNVVHVFREGNKLVDGLARFGHNMEIGLLFFEEPPLETSDIFDADFRSLACFR